MIRLIVTDYDNTLVPEGKKLSNAFFTKLHQISTRGVLFAVASGRPYNQLKKFFTPVSQEIVFISDDGAQMMYRNCVLNKSPLCFRAVKELCASALAQGMTPIVALREENRRVTEEQLALPFFFSSDIFKVILVKNGKSTASVCAIAQDRQMRCCYEDERFLEFCRADVNKGAAVKKLMEKFNVTPEQTVVFGDGENDLPLFHLASTRFAPAGAADAVKRLATGLTDDVEQEIMKL